METKIEVGTNASVRLKEAGCLVGHVSVESLRDRVIRNDPSLELLSGCLHPIETFYICLQKKLESGFTIAKCLHQRIYTLPLLVCSDQWPSSAILTANRSWRGREMLHFSARGTLEPPIQECFLT